VLSPLNSLIDFEHYHFYIQAKEVYMHVIDVLVIKAFYGTGY